jgi:hypothetical protein
MYFLTYVKKHRCSVYILFLLNINNLLNIIRNTIFLVIYEPTHPFYHSVCLYFSLFPSLYLYISRILYLYPLLLMLFYLFLLLCIPIYISIHNLPLSIPLYYLYLYLTLCLFNKYINGFLLTLGIFFYSSL